jgi:hypothetical protein
MNIPVRKTLSKTFGPLFENGFGWTMRHNEELYEWMDLIL